MKTKFDISKIDGINYLNNTELININGGTAPSKDTSLANDMFHYLSFGAHKVWDGLRAWSSSAQEGQSLRFSG